MKSISTELDTHLQQEVTTVARCWHIIRQDGTEFFFTSHDVDLPIDGDTYKASIGFANTAIQNKSDLSVDNLDVAGVFDDDAITLEDLRAGLFDYADVYIFLVNWQDLTQGVLKMRRGKLGEVTSSPQGWFQSELRGLTQLLQQNTIELYGPECRADLFDGRCASGGSLDADDWKAHLQLNAQGVGGFPNRWTTIAGVNGVDPTPPGYPSGIVANSGFFTYGVLQFTTGNNTGWRGEIKHHASGQIELFIQPPYPMQTNDEFDMWPGCDKSIGTCKSKFNNRLNFRGEPYLPGNDQVFFYPDAKS